eukprot:10051629-Ditylum_brightwellii.AAC.1
MLICQLHNNSKPAQMRFNTYVACCQGWVYHLNSRYLNITITWLTEQENLEAVFSHQPKFHQAMYVLEREEVKMTLRNSECSSMVATQVMKLMVPTLMSSRISVTPSVLKARRNLASQAAAKRAPTSTTLGNLMEDVVQ